MNDPGQQVTASTPSTGHNYSERNNHHLRITLVSSHLKAVSSSFTIGITDNFLTAFTIHLHATLAQIAWLIAILHTNSFHDNTFQVLIHTGLPWS